MTYQPALAPPGRLQPSVSGSVQHNTNRIPPKRQGEGDFEHAHYVPPWMDPDWEDEGPARDASDWPIRSGLLDRVRPALLARDQIKNPTPNAKRWGIFHGRADGRSRTSPTRSNSRQLPLDHTVQTGKQVFDELERSVLGQHGRDLDEYMTSERPDLKTLDEREQRYMQAYQELIIDEHWQGALFGNLTMDELIAGNHFTMGDVTLDPSGPIHPLYERWRWTCTKKDGADQEYPRYLYNVDGKRLEFDPRVNNDVWNALQPALRLASRMLSTDEPFVEALRDVTNRMPISAALRHGEDTSQHPKFKFSRHFDDQDPSYPEAFADVRNDASIDHLSLSEQVMDEHFKLRILSVNRDSETGGFVSDGAMGATELDIDGYYGSLIVGVAAELIWPLLTDHFSSSEKMMASYTFAVTLVHETMHAYEYANTYWIRYPEENGIEDDYLLDIIEELRQEYIPPPMSVEEPYFEEDPLHEVGHAYESHVLGVGCWPLHDCRGPDAKAQLLAGYGIVAVHQQWPDGIRPSMTPMLNSPNVRLDTFNYLAKIDHVQRYFRREFWDVSVAKFGMAAWREPPKQPSLCCFNTDTDHWTRVAFQNCNAGTEEDREWIEDFIRRLRSRGKRTLSAYVNALIADSCRFEITVQRFMRDGPPWADSFNKTQNAILSLALVIAEFSTRHWVLYGNPNHPGTQLHIAEQHRRWVSFTTNGSPILDDQSRRCIDDIETFKAGCQGSNAVYEQRIVKNLIQVAVFLDDELRFQESMMVDMYSLPSIYWKQLADAVPGHQEGWIHRLIQLNTQLPYIIQCMDQGVAASLPWWPEWGARMRSYVTRFQAISDLFFAGGSPNPPDWRNMLVTTPLLRRTHRKAWEQLYFLAKKEMLSLEGDALTDFKEFKTRFQSLLALGSHKITLPEDNPDIQGLAQLWAGVLDDVIEKQKSGGELNQIFSLDRVKQLTQELEEEKKKAEAAQRERAGLDAAEPAVTITLGHLAQVQNGKAPTNPPQVTRPQMEHHPATLSALQLSTPVPRFGEPSRAALPITNSPRHGLSPGAFTSYTSPPNPFPTPSPGNPSSWAPRSAAQLAAQIHQPFGNTPTPPQPVGNILHHPYAIRTTTTSDLRYLATTKVPVQPAPTSFPHQAPRDAPALAIGLGGVGAGRLGDLDQNWAVQSKAEELEALLAQQKLDKENQEKLLEAQARAHELAEEEKRRQGQDSDVVMADANMARAIVDSESESGSGDELASDVEEVQRRSESSESSGTTPFVSKNASEDGSASDSDGGSRSAASSQGSKRRFSMTEPGLGRRDDTKKFMEWWQSRAAKRVKRSP